MVLACVALPAFLASRPPASPAAHALNAGVPKRPEDPLPPSPNPTKEAVPPPPIPQVDRTRAIAAWDLTERANAHESAARIKELLRAEPDDRVRCEILGAASTLDATPGLRQVFEESSQPAQSSRVRQVALDLWLTVYPDEAATIARRFLTDADEDVRGVAEDYLQEKQEEARTKGKE